jgi:hypothetical protein
MDFDHEILEEKLHPNNPKRHISLCEILVFGGNIRRLIVSLGLGSALTWPIIHRSFHMASGNLAHHSCPETN